MCDSIRWYAISSPMYRLIIEDISCEGVKSVITKLCHDKRRRPNFIKICRDYVTYEIGRDCDSSYGRLFLIGTEKTFASLGIIIKDGIIKETG